MSRWRSSTGNAGYTMVPLQTALPLRALAACGYAADPRAERAYEWLLAQRLPDGAWPTGIAAGNYGRVAGYRRLPHSAWGCRSDTTGALICLALHPQRRRDEPARRGLDLLLGCEMREQHTLGFEVGASARVGAGGRQPDLPRAPRPGADAGSLLALRSDPGRREGGGPRRGRGRPAGTLRTVGERRAGRRQRAGSPSICCGRWRASTLRAPARRAPARRASARRASARRALTGRAPARRAPARAAIG